MKNHVVVDPTGHGIADAQQDPPVIRLAPQQDENKNTDSLAFRYFKFRMRGYVPEEGTLAHIQKLAAEKVPEVAKDVNPDGLPSRLRSMVGKMANSPEKLARLRAVMVEDGMGHLYDKFIQPHEHYMQQWGGK